MLYAGKSRHLPVKAYGDLAEEGDAIAYGVPAEGDSDSSDYEADEEIYGYGEGAHRKNPHPGLNSTYLIPGGRLLVTVDKTWLVLSDLGPPGETDKPAILSKHRLDSEGWLTILNVSMANDHNTLHIVIHEYLRRRLPPYVDPSRVMLGSDSRMVSALHRFELRLSADGEYTLQCLGRLCVVDEDEFEADHMVATQCAHQVALKTDSGRIILWDTLESDGTVVFWEAPESYVLSVQLGYLMTVTKDGVQAIDLSIIPRNPISNGLVELRTSSATAPPSTSQSINHPVDLENIEGVTVLPSIPARGPVRYDVEVKEGNGYGTHLRFSLDFCPDEPSPSNLIFLGKRDEGEAQIESWSKHRFETFSGYWGCVWEALPDVSSIDMTIYDRSAVLMGSESGNPQDDQELQDSHMENIPRKKKVVAMRKLFGTMKTLTKGQMTHKTTTQRRPFLSCLRKINPPSLRTCIFARSLEGSFSCGNLG